MDYLNVAWKMYHQGQDKEFMFAYLDLGGRLLSHYESIRILLNQGFYGNALIIFRSVLGATYLLLDFRYHPQNIKLWLELQSYNPLTSQPPRNIRKIQDQFKEGVLRKRLRNINNDIDALVDHSGYTVFSEAVHPSAWGSQHFGRTHIDNPDISGIQFIPNYQPQKLVAIWSLLADIPRRWILVLGERLLELVIHDEELKQYMSRYNSLSREQDDFRGKYTLVADKWLEAEERVRAGESFEQAFSLERLFDSEKTGD